MILIAGLVLMALGFFSGGTLLASSLGWITLNDPTVLWLMFPIGSITGLLIAALASRVRAMPVLLKISGTIMIVLSLIAIVTLVLGSAGLIATPRGTLALWYVFAVGLAIGAVDLLIPISPSQPA